MANHVESIADHIIVFTDYSLVFFPLYTLAFGWLYLGDGGTVHCVQDQILPDCCTGRSTNESRKIFVPALPSQFLEGRATNVCAHDLRNCPTDA